MSGQRRDSAGRRSVDRQTSRTLNIKRRGSDDEAKAAVTEIEYGNTGVQESDGCFFESFTALAWKQENRKLRAASEDEKEAEKPPPSESKLGPRPKLHHLARNEFELLYIEVLYTIKHKIGQTSGTHLPFIQDLYLYAREAFGVTPEDHARLLARASEEKPPILILNVTIVEAKSLEAKDADGFSDPYCMLGIMPGSKARERLGSGSDSAVFSSDDESKPKDKDKKQSGLKKFSFKRRKDKEKGSVRDLLPAKYIRTTSVMPNTLNPEWNEKFRFDLDDVHSDRLHLDIWDHDDEFSVFDAASKLNEVTGFKGLGRFFKQVAQSARSGSSDNVDDFLGCVDLKLDEIPSTGLDHWFDLEGRTSKSNVEGQIHLRLNLATREDRGIPEEDNWTDIRQHEDLMGIFVDHEITKFRYETYQWGGSLPQAALTILHQHAIQGDITEVQQAMCRWMAYSKKHMERPFDYTFLIKLLHNLDDIWEPAELSREEEESLAAAFSMFIEHCLSLINNHREIYPAANKTAFHRLENMLRCLALIYDMKVFHHCCPFKKELHSEVIHTLKKGNQLWYERTKTAVRPLGNADEDTIQSLIDLTNAINTDMQKAVQYYHNIFEKIVKVNYVSVTFKQVEKLVARDAASILEEELGSVVKQEVDSMETFQFMEDDYDSTNFQLVGTSVFELYLALQEFCKFREHLLQQEKKNLDILQYYDWFRAPVYRWLAVSRHKAHKRIRKSVELDKIGSVEGDIKQSTSAIDVCCCYKQIIDFWRTLEWPDMAAAYPYAIKITEDLAHGAMLYADLIHGKLRAAGYYDEEGQFDVTEQLCITINDIEQVRRALKPLPDALRYAEIGQRIEAAHGEKPGQAAYKNLCGSIKAADDDMVKKIKQVVDKVADRMRPDIKKDVFHLCWTPESVPAETAIGDLMEYLDSNLLTLNSNLLRTNFNRILESIWIEVLEEFQEVLDTEEEENKNSAFYERLNESLNILVDFFHAGSKGLSMTTLKGDQHNDLYKNLTLNRLDTSSLIEIYYNDKVAEHSKIDGSKYGILSVRVYYSLEAERLFVEVLNARNLIPLDTNGLSDPFVIIEFGPTHVFPNVQVQKTEIVKKTLHPVFDESFEFAVTVEQCRHKGATILFTVMDHDIMFMNDFAGEAYLSLNSIPGIDGSEVSGFTALKPFAIPLTHPVPSKGVNPLTILESRTTDKDAQEFVKRRRQVESQSQGPS